MLRRKYLAQRGNSKGSMNTAPVSIGATSYLHKKLQCCPTISKNVPNRTAYEKIHLTKLKAIVCNPPSFVAKECVNRSGPTYNDGSCQNIVITKNVKVAIEQGQKIENLKGAIELDCSGNFWGAPPIHKNC